MRAIISVGGRFHAFNLAAQLEKHEALERLITSYPKYEVVKYGIPGNKVSSIVAKEVIQRFWDRTPAGVRARWDYSWFLHELFDKKASRLLVPAGIFVGWSSFSLRAMRAAKNMGMVTVLDHGSSHIEYQRDILKEEYERFGLRPVLPHPKIVAKELKEYSEADRIAIPSLFVKRTFIEKGVPESKLIHVPYGVDLSRFRQVPKEDNVFRVIFAGGMTLRKGVHYLMQAFAELKLPNSELMLIGTMNDEMKKFFERYEVRNNTKIRKGENGINYIGHVPQAELYKYYSQGSVFAMMSIEEGLALVQPQAMACGLPVIATTNTGAEDIVREGKDGFIIPIRDIAALKEKLVYLYEHPDVREAMSRSAKERVSSGFTWDDYGNKMVAEYEKILKGK